MKKLKVKDGEKKFNMYMQVHLVKTSYTCWSTIQKEYIHIHVLPREEMSMHTAKPRFWSEVFGPNYWSEVFGPRYWT